jgi:hypothetical protein
MTPTCANQPQTLGLSESSVELTRRTYEKALYPISGPESQNSARFSKVLSQETIDWPASISECLDGRRIELYEEEATFPFS